MKAKQSLQKLFLRTGIALFTLLLISGGVLLFFTLMEYRPDAVEILKVEGEASKHLKIDEEISVLSWNIGYLALGERSDFFMDGGKMVRGFSKEDIENNLNHVTEEIRSLKADIVLLQEVDKKSYRSFNVDEVQSFKDSFLDYQTSYARNFKSFFVPFPFPPIRHVDAGMLSLSKYDVKSANRVSLPSPFRWPVKTVNLKRCLLVNRIPILHKEKELVLINLHLEAYDESGGALKQLEFTLDLIREEYQKGNYVIAGGDFNQIFSTITDEKYHNYAEGIWVPGEIEVREDEPFFYLMDEKVPSCRSLHSPYTKEKGFPHYIIDGFLVTKNLEITSFKTIPLGFKHSDHNPVYLKVKLK